MKRTVKFKVVTWQVLQHDYRTLITVDKYEQAEEFINQYPEDRELQIHKVYVKEPRTNTEGSEL